MRASTECYQRIAGCISSTGKVNYSAVEVRDYKYSSVSKKQEKVSPEVTVYPVT